MSFIATLDPFEDTAGLRSNTVLDIVLFDAPCLQSSTCDRLLLMLKIMTIYFNFLNFDAQFFLILPAEVEQ